MTLSSPREGVLSPGDGRARCVCRGQGASWGLHSALGVASKLALAFEVEGAGESARRVGETSGQRGYLSSGRKDE